MKKSEIQKLVRECLKEAIFKRVKPLNEAQRQLTTNTLSFGSLGKYEYDQLANDPELPKRIDYNPKVVPRVPPGERGPDEQQKSEVKRKSLVDLEKILVDGIPLTQLYDWELEVSSFNPHGYGSPQWHYYMVGMRAPKNPTSTSQTNEPLS
jgi:hypothetical protein